MLKPYLEKLLAKENLTIQEAEQAMNSMLSGANCEQIAALLVLLRIKPETADELLGIIYAMQNKMIPLPVTFPVLDIVGTGGDRANTVNISTGAALLAASCGVKIAKHGNRSVSSMCGSADVLEALGFNLNLSPTQIVESITKFNFGFCFAPNFHPALQALRAIRKNLGMPTCFNLLGPLLNPARAEYLLIGVFNESLMPLIAEIVNKLKIKRSLVFHGNDLDELSCLGPTKVIEITETMQRSYLLDAKDFGLARCKIDDLRGGDKAMNAQLLQEVFHGKAGAIANTLIFNAAVAVYVYGLMPSIATAINLVRQKIQTGETARLLEQLIEFGRLG